MWQGAQLLKVRKPVEVGQILKINKNPSHRRKMSLSKKADKRVDPSQQQQNHKKKRKKIIKMRALIKGRARKSNQRRIKRIRLVNPRKVYHHI